MTEGASPTKLMPVPTRTEATYLTDLGAAYVGDSRKLLNELQDNSINLVITSPPFALQRKKEYGNKLQNEYVDWLTEFAELVHKKLRDDGSFVIDLGGSYQKGTPTRSLYQFRVLIKLCDDLGFHLAEEFYWHNTSKLPGPTEWVNKRKIRVKDSVNTIWWLSKTPWPKADAGRVLSPYSKEMRVLIKDPQKFYTPRLRPSGHDISARFGRDNGGSIPSNLLQFPNSESVGRYLTACKLVGAAGHPARFPEKLPDFFIKFLTDPGDVVLDIFAGSNTTGQAAQKNGRHWIAFEERLEYVAASAFRFLDPLLSNSEAHSIYQEIMSGFRVDLCEKAVQHRLLS